MYTTRRGFLGALAALAVAPKSMLARVTRKAPAPVAPPATPANYRDVWSRPVPTFSTLRNGDILAYDSAGRLVKYDGTSSPVGIYLANGRTADWGTVRIIS